MKLSSLKTRLTVVNATIFIIASIVMVFLVNYFEKQNAFKNAEAKSTILLKHNLAIHSYINTKLKPTLFALTDTIRKPEYFDPTWMSSTYAVRDIDKLYRQNIESGYYYKEAAINSRSPENEADDFERDFIQKLNKDKNFNKISGVRDFEGKPYFFTLIRGESMEKGCMRCHSTPDKAPANLVKTYGDTRSFNRSIDEAVSAISIRMPLELPYHEANVLSAKLSGMLIILLLITFSLQIRFINQLVLTPLKRFKAETESIANNPENLGSTLPHFDNKEMDEIANSFNSMSGKLRGFVDSLDLTIRERTATLSESEAKYRLLFENMTNGFALHEMIYDIHGDPSDYRFIEVNSAFEKLTGLKASEIIGRTVLDSMPNTEKYWIETYGKVAAHGEPISFENFSQELGRHFQVSAFCPKPGFFATSISDITERKQAEENLLVSELRFRSLFNQAHEGIIIMTREGVLSEVNQSFADMHGYTVAELMNLDIRELDVLKETSMQDRSDIISRMEAGELVTFEVEHFHKDGHVFPLIVTTGITELNGELFFQASHQDITELKQAEADQLLLAQQFQQTQKLESLGVLSGGIAHDFNNIMAIIVGYCGLTKMDYETAENNINEIEKAAERAAALCRQMLAYAGKAQLTMAKVNMWMLVDEIVTMLKSTLPKNAEIKPELSADIPFIDADASQIRQIVMNLIINASEAIGNEHGEIQVSLSRTTERDGQSDKDYNGNEIPSGGYILLEVTDNGCGMDEETKWRIFEPFYTTKFTGRGLGMSAVLGIIKSHGGALQLYSQLGQGTTFKVYLPVPKKYATGDEGQKQSMPSAPWQGSGTILLVEDEEQIRLIAKALLKKFGFTVLEALNGKEALELYQRNATDITVVMTDMGMPIMDGYELFHQLKKINPKLPIIVSSGYGDAEVSSRIDIDAIAGLISKPYNPNQLREVLKSVVEGAK